MPGLRQLLHRQAAAKAAPQAGQAQQGGKPITALQAAPQPSNIYTSDFTAVSTAVAGQDSVFARYIIPESQVQFLDTMRALRLFVKGEESQSFTSAAAPSTKQFTLNGPIVQSPLAAPALPADNHPDARVYITGVGYLPVTAIDYAGGKVTVDTSSLTGSTAYTALIRYLPAGGSVTVRLSAPTGQTVESKAQLFSAQSDLLFQLDPSQIASAPKMRPVNGQLEVQAPQFWKVELSANYPNSPTRAVVPTLTDSDVLIPGHSVDAHYNDPATASAMQRHVLGS